VHNEKKEIKTTFVLQASDMRQSVTTLNQTYYTTNRFMLGMLQLSQLIQLFQNMGAMSDLTRSCSPKLHIGYKHPTKPISVLSLYIQCSA